MAPHRPHAGQRGDAVPDLPRGQRREGGIERAVVAVEHGGGILARCREGAVGAAEADQRLAFPLRAGVKPLARLMIVGATGATAWEVPGVLQKGDPHAHRVDRQVDAERAREADRPAAIRQDDDRRVERPDVGRHADHAPPRTRRAVTVALSRRVAPPRRAAATSPATVAAGSV